MDVPPDTAHQIVRSIGSRATSFTQKALFALAADVGVSQLVHHASTYDFGNLVSVF